MGYQRFMVESKNANLSAQAIEEKLNLFKFQPLHSAGEDTETFGWSPYLGEYDHEKDIFVSDFLYDKNMVLSMRFDTIKLPRELLKMMVKKGLAAYVEKNQKTPDRVVRKEIEIAQARILRARVLPKTKIVEAIWLVDTNELRIFNRSATMVERFLQLFKQTFLLTPLRQDFIQKGLGFAQVTGQAGTLESLSHQAIFAPPIRFDIQ